jgi:CRP-like cAMP-binding protein
MNPNEHILALLRHIPLFAELDQPELDRLAQIAVRRPFACETQVVRENDTENHNLYCVLSGVLKVTKAEAQGRALWINILGKGSCIGEIALLDRGPRSASVTGLGPGELLVIRGDAFHDLLHHAFPSSIAFKLMMTLARRVRELTERVHDDASLSASKRLAKRLDQLADLIGQEDTAKQVYLQVKLSQTDIGDMVRATRETVNKCERALRRKGLIQRTGSYLVILDRAGLKRELEGVAA